MSGRSLDFLVVGAQKAGTTALHMQMRSHPRILLPTAKEAPYFNRVQPEQTLSEFLDRHVPATVDSPRRGKVSPQYMSNRATVERIAYAMPEVRVVACLRDPIQRAVSHYNMLVRRGTESRPIDDALQQCASRETLARARDLAGLMQHESDCYVAWGEYGRILRYYLDAFPADRLLVIFFEDFVADPGSVLSKVFDFVGVDPSFRPDNAGARYYESAGGSRFPALKNLLRRVDRSGLRNVVPSLWRDRLKMRFRMVDERPRAQGQRVATISDLSDATRERLVELYREDLASLPAWIHPQDRWNQLADTSLTATAARSSTSPLWASS